MKNNYINWQYNSNSDRETKKQYISHKELEFATFCIEILREKKLLTSTEAYQLLTEKTNVMYDFLIPNYEILHSQSKEYILTEMLTALEEAMRC